MCGSHADVDIGDSDGLSESSRTPKHVHTGPSHTHSFSATTGNNSASELVSGPGGVTVADDPHTHTVSGTTGSGGTGNTGTSFGSFQTVGIMIVKY